MRNGTLGRTRPSSPLAGREFRALWWAEAISLVGDQLTRVAVSIMVYERTASAALTAVTYAMTYLPDAIAGPLVSGLADRLPRRELMLVCCLLQSVLIAAMTVPGLPIWGIALLVASSAFIQAPFRAAQTASVRVVAGGQDDMVNVANSRMILMRESGQLAGLAGASVAITVLGLTPALVIDAISFVIAGVLLAGGLRRRPAARPARQSRPAWHRDPRHRPLIVFTLLCSLTVLPFGLVVPLIDELNAPTWATGLLLAADPAGMVVAGHIVWRRVPLTTQMVWMGPLATLCLAAMIPMAVVTHWLAAAVLLFVSGAAAVYTITAKTSFLQTVPDHSTGFAAGLVRTGLRVSQGLVLLVGGWIAEAVLRSAANTITWVGAAGVGACLLNELSWRRARHHNPRIAPAAPDSTHPESGGGE